MLNVQKAYQFFFGIEGNRDLMMRKKDKT